MEGESKEAGYFLASIAKEIKVFNRPISPPCYVVCSGETTTQINEQPVGAASSHELVVGFSICIDGISGIAAASIDTEGTDSSTKYAGGLVDSQTYTAFKKKGEKSISGTTKPQNRRSSYRLWEITFLRNTGTNLCDLNVIYIE